VIALIALQSSGRFAVSGGALGHAHLWPPENGSH
jgi:hypothetical protein